MEPLTWHCIQTAPQAEPAVDAKLRRMGYETLFLRYLTTVRHARKESRVLRPYLRGYLFVGLDGSQGLYGVNTCPGVTNTLSNCGRPSVVPETVMAGLFELGGEDGMVAVPDSDTGRTWRMAKGALCKVLEGPFAGHAATVIIDKGREIVCNLHLFGRELTAPFSPEALHPQSGGCANG